MLPPVGTSDAKRISVVDTTTMSMRLLYQATNHIYISGYYNIIQIDLSGKEPHRQVGVGRVVTSGNLGGVMI